MEEDRAAIQGTAFAITFGKLSPTYIENESSGEEFEYGEEMLATAAKVLADVTDPIAMFAESVTVNFDGDLDDANRFLEIKITGFTGPECCSEADCSFGHFAIYGVASISDDYADEDKEEILEDILHALVINLAINDYSVTLGYWEEYLHFKKTIDY